MLALARTDFEEATAVAESIADPATRAWALVHLADRLPAAERDRKLALLARALLQARTAADQADRLLQMGEVAERWYELGEVDKAKALFAEGLQIARQFTDKTDFKRGLFAARLARVDLPAALAIVKDFDGERDQGRILGGIALRLIERNPAEAERIWNRTKGKAPAGPNGPDALLEDGRGRSGAARRVIEALAGTQYRPHFYLFLALGSKARDESASRQAFQTGVRRDRSVVARAPRNDISISREHCCRSSSGSTRLSCPRSSGSTCPRGFPSAIRARSMTYSPSYLITRLAWYDRDVAAALIRAQPGSHRTRPAMTTSAVWTYDFLAWSLFDPRAAVARLEKLPIDPKLQNNAIHARLAVAESLAQDREERVAQDLGRLGHRSRRTETRFLKFKDPNSHDFARLRRSWRHSYWPKLGRSNGHRRGRRRPGQAGRRCPGRVLRSPDGLRQGRSRGGANYEPTSAGQVQPENAAVRTDRDQWRQFLAYRPDLAITAHPIIRRPYRLVLEKPTPRTVMVEGADGKPIAGPASSPV